MSLKNNLRKNNCQNNPLPPAGGYLAAIFPGIILAATLYMMSLPEMKNTFQFFGRRH